uniref:Uncharacterized protein n=1 Tax=Tanacetum cinerariifolium TaxID=118510 RepID=A0A699IEP7_TANCI|nr:hypothetical protein [Tanacetum cinerariifolium]
MAQLSCSNGGSLFNSGNYPSCSIVGAENEFVHDPNLFPYDNAPDFYDQPPQHHVEIYSCELCGNDSHYLITSSVEDLVLILSESEDTSGSNNECDLPSCDDFSPINVPEGQSMTFSNPLFDSNDDFTSSDDESLFDEDVLKDNVKIYSNPLFEFDDEYIPSDVNPLFDEVLEDIESKASYDSNLDETNFQVTPLFDSIEDECFDPRGYIDEINAFLDADVSIDIEDDHDPRSFKDKPDNDDLKNMVKVFDLGIHKKIIALTYVRLPFEDRHYFSLTFVIRIFLPYFTYLVDSPFPLSSGSKDIIFDPGISAFSFYSLELEASHQSGTFICFNVYPNILNESPIEICSSTCFNPNITMIWGESS